MGWARRPNGVDFADDGGALVGGTVNRAETALIARLAHRPFYYPLESHLVDRHSRVLS